MNTTQLKKFAAEARTILKEGVILRLSALGFNADGSVAEEDRPQKGQGFVLFRGEALPDDGFYEKWQSLYKRVQKKGIQEVYEEAAYTWFNRLTAIRIMARNGFITPVLEYVSNSTRVPVILSQARQGQYPEMTAAEREQLMAIIDDGRKSQEQFAILITAYCHTNPIINKCFGGVTDYTTLLLPQNIIAEGGFIDLLNNTPFITEDDYKSAELIGWLYQFYISEKKDDVFASFKAGKKAEAEDIPAATQIFTPNWIVKYMVQNTLGRIYLDNNPYDTDMKEKMQYLVEPSEPTPEEAKFKYESLEDLRLGDLACGSGHILNEFFDLMYLFYIEDGYSRRNAIENIFLKNLTGIDLDTRAKQLAQFALMVKACQKDPSFLDARVMPNVLDMPAPLDMNMVKATLPEFFLGGAMKILQETEDAFELMQQAENLGSIMKFNISDSTRAAIEIRLQEWESQPTETVSDSIKALLHSFRLILALTQKYSALVMNPPYMGQGNMNTGLSKYIVDNYQDSKNDLMTVFMALALNRLKNEGYFAMINYQSWMFLSSFKEHRNLILNNQIDSLIHLGRGIFGSDFGTVTFAIKKSLPYRKGIYRRLFEKHVSVRSIDTIKNLFFDTSYGFYETDQKFFLTIPGNPIGYWIKNVQLFDNKKLKDYPYVSGGRNKTHDNNKYVRFFWEISNTSKRWRKYSNGGDFRKYYGEETDVVDWSETAKEFYASHGGLLSPNFQNTEGITWFLIAASASFRYKSKENIFSSGSPTIISQKHDCDYYVLGLLNSVVTNFILKLYNPTVNTTVGDVLNIPYIVSEDRKNIADVVKTNVDISREDWDAHEISWDFQRNELLSMDTETMLANIDWHCDQHYKETGEQILVDPAAPEPEKIEWCYRTYTEKWERLHHQLQENETELNKKFIEIYGLQGELFPDVLANEVTILQQGEVSYLPEPGGDDYFIQWNKDEVIRQLISYAIGCWMGRYRLDKSGLYIAHPDAKPEEIATYEYNGQSFEIDDDGIIPLLPAYASFPDNGYKRVQDFVRIAFGAETLTENINFIEEALGVSLEKFMVKDFWKYHKKMYQNRPIYWLFSSKKGAFQCLTYMHRMNAYTVEQIRSKYLLPHIDWLKNHIAEMESRASQLTTQERKLKDQMAKDLAECIEYHDDLHIVADQNISFDLDNGVVENYKLFGNVLAKLK